MPPLYISRLKFYKEGTKYVKVKVWALSFYMKNFEKAPGRVETTHSYSLISSEKNLFIIIL